jgi:uncharacterized protein
MRSLRQQKRNMRTQLLLLFVTCALAHRAEAQLILSDFTTRTIDFAGYTGAGFQPDPGPGQLSSLTWSLSGIAGQSLAFGGTSSSIEFARGTASGTVSSGGLYSFTNPAINGGTGSFGIQPIASVWNPGSVTLRVQNDTGKTIPDLQVSYEIWVRNDQPRSTSLNLAYSLDNTAFTPVPALDFASPAAADALGFQRTDQSILLSGLNIGSGDYFYLRWSGADVGGSGNRDEFALDNIALTPVPEPHEYGLVAGLGLVGFALWRRRFADQQPLPTSRA